MRTDYNNHQNYSLEKIKSLFNPLNIEWGFSGGWALDLFIGQQSREHSDVDVCVLTQDLAVIYEKLSNEFIFYKAFDGRLQYWLGEPLTPKYSIWVAEQENKPFVFEIVLIESSNEEWFYKRNNDISGLLDQLFVKGEYLYLSPEIALLYKMEASVLREKDIEDYKRVYPKLSVKQQIWLDNHCSYK